ncbi:hypothetical protein N9N03_01895 [Chlamydiia bacterium]|jgi:hypothetical protein|nr:hypothetical protein [Chlamydiia bacterium]
MDDDLDISHDFMDLFSDTNIDLDDSVEYDAIDMDGISDEIDDDGFGDIDILSDDDSLL